jgi:TolA-binding protein
MPNYIYWRGESLYALGDYENAIQSFHDVLEKYPNSLKSDDAEYKIAASYEKLGENEIAKSAYQRLILSYPDSEYISRAKARLKKLN